MKPSVAPFLMFEGKAEEALSFYVSVVPNSRLIEIERYGAGGPGTEGSVMRATVSIGGLEVMATDSPVRHGFTFTPSISLFVTCSSEDEIDRLAATLGDGGQVLMELGNYGFSRRFTWVNDRYGVSWQLNLA